MKKFIVVAGNIGVGKSTLVDLLCRRLGWEPFLEPEANNPYLSDFYKDMKAWSFHSQVYFLTHRARIHRRLCQMQQSVIQDRSIYEDAEIFARNLFLQGILSDRDHRTYTDLFHTIIDFLMPPDLVIYLRATVPLLQKRIALRNRDYEKDIDPVYLDQLNRLYSSWIAEFTHCPVLMVPADELDYVAHPEHLDLISRKVQEKLTGKDEVIFSPDEI